MALHYVGTAAAADTDLAYREYIQTLKDADLSVEDIDAAIASGLSGYVNKSYVNSQDALLATAAYIDAQDNLRIKTASKNIPNGVAGLDATGRIAPARIDAPNTQQYFRGPWSPTAYHTATTVTAESTLYSCPVTDPGYTYRLVVFGEVDAHTNLDAEYPEIRVRVADATTGEVIARGRGALDAMDTYQSGDNFERPDSTTIGGGWDVTQVEGTDTESIGINSGEAEAQYEEDTAYRARRVDPLDMHTGTNLQKCIATIGADDGTNTADPYTRLILRENDAGTSYVAWEVRGNGSSRLVYANGAGESQLGGTTSMSRPTMGTQVIGIAGTEANPRLFQLYRNTTLIASIDDTGAVTPMGVNNRGWGFEMRTASGSFFTTQRPPTFESITIGDNAANYAPVVIIPDLSTMTPRTGATTLYVRALRSGASSTQNISAYKPRLFVMAVPA